jgi:hypothetical protein
VDGAELFADRAFGGGMPVVTITVPAKVAHNLDEMQNVVRRVAGILGCEGCHSGFDFRFRQALDFVVSQKGQVISLGVTEPVG